MAQQKALQSTGQKIKANKILRDLTGSAIRLLMVCVRIIYSYKHHICPLSSSSSKAPPWHRVIIWTCEQGNQGSLCPGSCFGPETKVNSVRQHLSPCCKREHSYRYLHHPGEQGKVFFFVFWSISFLLLTIRLNFIFFITLPIKDIGSTSKEFKEYS